MQSVIAAAARNRHSRRAGRAARRRAASGDSGWPRVDRARHPLRRGRRGACWLDNWPGCARPMRLRFAGRGRGAGDGGGGQRAARAPCGARRPHSGAAAGVGSLAQQRVVRIQQHLRWSRLQRHGEGDRCRRPMRTQWITVLPRPTVISTGTDAVKSSSTPGLRQVPTSRRFGALPFTLQCQFERPESRCRRPTGRRRVSNFGSSDFGGRYSDASRRNSSVVMSLRS